MAQVPPSNLVFLIDVSGSMDMPNRLPLLKTAFKLMVNNLRPIDTISIVVYGGTVGVCCSLLRVLKKKRLIVSLKKLSPGGSTCGESGILAACRLAESTFIPNGNNRVVHGKPMAISMWGKPPEEALERMIVQQRQKRNFISPALE